MHFPWCFCCYLCSFCLHVRCYSHIEKLLWWRPASPAAETLQKTCSLAIWLCVSVPAQLHYIRKQLLSDSRNTSATYVAVTPGIWEPLVLTPPAWLSKTTLLELLAHLHLQTKTRRRGERQVCCAVAPPDNQPSLDCKPTPLRSEVPCRQIWSWTKQCASMYCSGVHAQLAEAIPQQCSVLPRSWIPIRNDCINITNRLNWLLDVSVFQICTAIIASVWALFLRTYLLFRRPVRLWLVCSTRPLQTKRMRHFWSSLVAISSSMCPK